MVPNDPSETLNFSNNKETEPLATTTTTSSTSYTLAKERIATPTIEGRQANNPYSIRNVMQQQYTMREEAETTTSVDDTFDGETIDLFALMNSSMVELQIEMDLLESKEYLNDNGSDNASGNASDNGNDNGNENATDVAGDKEDHTLAQPSPSTFSSQFPSLPKLDGICEPEKTTTIGTGSATSTDISAATNTTIAVNWQAIEPARIGDHDYSPISDYTVVGPPVKLIAAKVGDQDYSPVSDYTSTTASTNATKTTTKSPKKSVTATVTAISTALSIGIATATGLALTIIQL
jgi:hypothetical protein